MNNIDFDISSSKKEIVEMVEEFKNRKEEAIRKNDGEAISYFSNQIENIEKDHNLIGKLADGNLIPKYGFPTDIAKMRVKEVNINQNEYDLTRDMKIAISEYTPDFEIMVDKKKIVSRYINKFKDLLHIYHYEYENWHKAILKYSHIESEFKCPNCGKNIANDKNNFYITPRYGFTGEIEISVDTTVKPKRSYSSPITYIGNGEIEGEEYVINDILSFYTVKNDELLVVNQNPFFVCKECGYSRLDKNNGHLPKIKDKDYHKKAYGFKSSEYSNQTLERAELGYSYKTDVLKLIMKLEISSYNQAISTLHALLEGIAQAFDIERNDIDGNFINEDNKNIFVLFDTVPGGAGHVKRLLDKEEMKKAIQYAFEKVNQNYCESACYSCLKNYNNQRYHEFLRREEAKKVLQKIIENFN